MGAAGGRAAVRPVQQLRLREESVLSVEILPDMREDDGGIGMSGIYISGVELSDKFPMWLMVYPDGAVEMCGQETWTLLDKPAIPVPDHGRLGDLDALEKAFHEDARDEWNKWASPLNWADAFGDVADIVRDEPTVIPADKGATE